MRDIQFIKSQSLKKASLKFLKKQRVCQLKAICNFVCPFFFKELSSRWDIT